MVLVDKKLLENVPREVISLRILCYGLILSFSGFLHGQSVLLLRLYSIMSLLLLSSG